MATKALLRHLEASENTGKPAQSLTYIKKVRWKPGLSWLRMHNMLRWVTVNPMGETVFHSVPGYTKACAPPSPSPHNLPLHPLNPPYNCCKLLRGTLAGSGQALRP